MFLTRLAVHRPISTLMVSLVVVLLGVESLRRLNVDLMPEMTYPVISVTTVYEGAGPEEIETLITRPLEQVLSSIQGAEELQSSSTEGSSSIRVRFAWNANLDSAVGDMRAKIERLRAKLPDDVDPPYVRRYDIADSPIIYLGLVSDLDIIPLTRLTETIVVPQLERIDGVASVRIRGGVRREIQVDLDRQKLEALNMGVNEIVESLRSQNVNQPAGDFEQGHLNLLVRSRGEFQSLKEIENTVIRERSGAVVRLRDIAKTIDGEERRTEMTRINQTPGLLVYINKQSGANTIEVSDRVRAAMGRINASMDKAELGIRLDKSEFIRSAIDNVRESAVYGMGLAVIVLILFLGSFRSTLVIGVSMPLSVMATFVLMFFCGFTLNMVSFGGLTLGIGLLVDNSIVVLESIYRKRDEGLSSIQAALDGTAEVSSAIVASTFTTLIVFLPILFFGGSTGMILQQMAWVVSFSLVCSLLASLTLVPSMAAHWCIVDKSGDRSGVSRAIHWVVGCFHNANRTIVTIVENAYGSAVRFTLRFWAPVSFVIVALFAASIGLYPRVGTEFLPKPDEGDIRVFAQMAPGIQTEELASQAEKLESQIAERVPEIRMSAAFIGDDAEDSDDWNEFWFRLHLNPRDERIRTVEEIRKDLDKTVRVPGASVKVQVRNEMSLTRFLSDSGGDIEVEVRGHDMKTAEELAAVTAAVMKSVEGFVNVEIELADKRPEVAATIDRSKASLLGVNVSDITQTLETTIRGTIATVFREDGDEFNVRVRLRETDRSQISDVEQVGVSIPAGRVVSLRNFVTFTPADGPVSIRRRDQQRVLVVSANVEDRDLGSAVRELQSDLNRVNLPEGFTLSIAGDWEDQQRSFADLRKGFVLAVLLMYMIMASQFESLRDPLLILLTIPLAAIGVLSSLVVSETTLNVQSFIGVIMLSGIVVNNAIVLIDYMNQLRRAHPSWSLNEIAWRAAVRRFRPILMTTATTVLAMIPIAIGTGEGGELQSPMAIVVIGGLLTSTLITLVAIPICYQLFAKRAQTSSETDSVVDSEVRELATSPN